MCDMAQVFECVISSMCHAPECLTSLRPSALLISLSYLPLHLPEQRLLPFSSSMLMCSEQDLLCTSPNEESGPLANNAPPTSYEPNFFDDFHFSETTEIFIQESSSYTRPSNLHDSEINDDTIGRPFHHCSLRSEKNQRAVDKLTTLF